MALLWGIGCGDDLPSSPWPDVSGIHRGGFVDLALPPRIAGTMTLDIVQADSLLSGTFAFSAIVRDSTGQPEDLVGRGTLYGTITEIPFSAIELEFIYSEDCGPWRDSRLVGEYMPDARAMNLRGTFRVYSVECGFGGLPVIMMRLAHQG